MTRMIKKPSKNQDRAQTVNQDCAQTVIPAKAGIHWCHPIIIPVKAGIQ